MLVWSYPFQFSRRQGGLFRYGAGGKVNQVDGCFCFGVVVRPVVGIVLHNQLAVQDAGNCHIKRTAPLIWVRRQGIGYGAGLPVSQPGGGQLAGGVVIFI